MAKTPAKSSPPTTTDETRRDTGEGGNRAESVAERRRGVLRQRQHIKSLTGEDPLRGGIAD